MKKSLLSVALCVMTLLIGISPVSAQGQNKEYQETLHKMLLLSGGLATVDTMVPQIIGMMKQQSPSVSEATWNAVMEKAKQFFSDNLVKVYVPIYQKHLTGPKISQDREPLVSGAIKIVTTNKRISPIYIM